MASKPLDEEAIFKVASKIESPQVRADYVKQACGDDQALLDRVATLLRAHEAAPSFLESPPPGIGPTIDRPTLNEQPDIVIGPYKLLQQIGEGGMGTVWMAEQTQPVQRKVALKLIKAGMDSRQVIARFEAERQALALMDHPNIAKVLDAGTTSEVRHHSFSRDAESSERSAPLGDRHALRSEDSASRLNTADGGRPYFVMELVKGVPITRYCDEHHLTPRQRLELFVPVCQAVQHAHQKGIIHRDLKPSNVMVCLYDGKPVPKVIDFGVAKAAGPRLTEKTLFTELGQVVGTLEYMSPEQAELNQLDIDTRSDIYSLGVLLYELLTGTTPLERKRFQAVAFLEVLRLIREEESPRPSTRLSTTEGLPSIAANRGLEPKKLSGLMRGELDWIVMKTLEKDRNRRYETANGLAMDVQRYLADEAVQACPPSTAYRLRKFLRRNKGPVLAVTLTVVLLVGGIIGTTLGLMRALVAERDATGQRIAAQQSEGQAKADRERARNALNTLTDDVIEQLLGKAVQLREHEKAFLRKVERFYEEFAHGQGDTAQARRDRAEGHHRVGIIRRRLGEIKEAEAAFDSAVALWWELADDYPGVPDYRRGLARSHNELGILLAHKGRPREAEAAYRKALALYQKLAGDPDVPDYRRELAGTQNNLGNLLKNGGQMREAETHLRDAVTVCEALVRQFPAEPSYRQRLADSHNNMGILQAGTGRLSKAEAAFREAVELGRKLAEDPSRPDFREQLAGRLVNLGNVLTSTAGRVAAGAVDREAVALWQKLSDDYPGVPGYLRGLAQSHNTLGALLADGGQHQEAEAAYREALALYQKLAARYPSVPVYRHEFAMSHGNLAYILEVTGRRSAAEEACGQAIALYQRLADEDPTQPDYLTGLAGTLVNLAGLKLAAGDYPEVRKLLERARRYQRTVLANNPQSPSCRQSFHLNLVRMCQALLGLGEHAAVAGEVEELARFGYAPVNERYNAARYLSWCIPMAEKDAQLAEAKRGELARRYGDRAMELLRQAVAAGFQNVAQMKKDPALDALRNRADFQKLLAGLEAGKAKAKK